MNNPYKVLGVSEGASQEEIRAAYLKLVKKYHPDKYTDTDLKELANEKLVEINEAYEALTKKNGSTHLAPGPIQTMVTVGKVPHIQAPTQLTLRGRARSLTRTTFRQPSRCWIRFLCGTPNGIIFTE